jgi:zinc-ribbon domain
LPAYVLTHEQMRTALNMAGIDVGPGSPLAALPKASRFVQPPDGAFQKMADGHLLENQDGSWRVNTLVRAVLLACAQPEEVLALRVTSQLSGFSVCRRGPLLTECTVGGPGLVKLSFPLTRSSITLMLTGALSGERPEAEPTGFRFQGRIDDAFVLSLLLNQARENSEGIAAGEIGGRVASAVENPALTLPFVLVASAEPLLALAGSQDAVEAAVGRLVMARHVRNDGGWLRPSSVALEALSSPPVAGFSVSRTLVGPDGPASQALEVARCGERNIVFRSLRHAGEQPLFEWSEMTRRQLRALVAATVMDERELGAMASAVPGPSESIASPSPEPAVAAALGGAFCMNCGTQGKPGQRFCRNCGTRLAED